tara:strand:- start:1741 stop:1983 length:243 start_codon:yes stop_codon:yes gene_type:complete
MNNYKYIIINRLTDEVTIQKNLRDIEKFINQKYPEETFSYSTISRRLRENTGKYFSYYDLIVKELLWGVDNEEVLNECNE